MQRLLECVPNFSEGRDPAVIRAIGDAIQSVEGVKLLDVDPGKATNRTVMTFVGSPEAVVEAAVRAGRSAAQLIDMRSHHGEHPRFGALDVCPLVPVAGVSMEEAVGYARELGRRFGEEVGMTVYFYERAATAPERRDLAAVRAGEYEGLKDKLADPRWRPDCGPAVFNPRSGATAVGARDFLVAYNVNLNTTSPRRANAIAFDVREKGREKRRGDPLSGPLVRDERGEVVWIPGSLKAVKGIGWYIEEYGVCQVSLNLTDISVTPVHLAFEEVCRKAEERGVRVTGSELVGLIPRRALLDAGRYFLRKQRRSTGVSDRELVKIAVKSLGLGDLKPFRPEEKVIESLLEDKSAKKLALLPLRDFVEETAAESPAPGGGSVAAAVGALGAALAAMVANLSAHKRGWDERWEEFSDWAERGKACYQELLRLVDEDTDAFNAVLAAARLPRRGAEEQAARDAALQAATRHAAEVPLRVMDAALRSMEAMEAMARIGMESSASDAGVAALCARAAVLGAFLNVQINARQLGDRTAATELLDRGEQLQVRAGEREAVILELVRGRIGVGSREKT